MRQKERKRKLLERKKNQVFPRLYKPPLPLSILKLKESLLAIDFLRGFTWEKLAYPYHLRKWTRMIPREKMRQKKSRSIKKKRRVYRRTKIFDWQKLLSLIGPHAPLSEFGFFILLIGPRGPLSEFDFEFEFFFFEPCARRVLDFDFCWNWSFCFANLKIQKKIVASCVLHIPPSLARGTLAARTRSSPLLLATKEDSKPLFIEVAY